MTAIVVAIRKIHGCESSTRPELHGEEDLVLEGWFVVLLDACGDVSAVKVQVNTKDDK
jgi:hypothetical protein